MASAQKNGGADATPQREENRWSGDDSTTNELWHCNYSTDGDARWVCICFNRCPVIFNAHTIFLTKSISSLSNLKSNDYKKSDIRIGKKWLQWWGSNDDNNDYYYNDNDNNNNNNDNIINDNDSSDNDNDNNEW